jgi:zinc-ribbon domain
MNCTHCNVPLEPEARFCRNCGMAISTGASQPAGANTAQANQAGIGDSPTVLTPPWQAQQSAPFQPQYPPPQSMPPQAYQPTVAVSPSPGSLPSTGAQLSSPPLPTRHKNRLVQVLLILVIALLVIMLVLVAGWFLALRPVLHGLAQSQLDGVLTSAVNQITPAEMALIPSGRASVPLTEADMNNFIASNTNSSDPVQQIHMTITPTVLRLDLQTFGITSTIIGVPQAVNGQVVITNVTVQGIASLLLSPEELTATLNAHLHDAGVNLHRTVTGVLLKNHEMDIQLR